MIISLTPEVFTVKLTGGPLHGKYVQWHRGQITTTYRTETGEHATYSVCGGYDLAFFGQ